MIFNFLDDESKTLQNRRCSDPDPHRFFCTRSSPKIGVGGMSSSKKKKSKKISVAGLIKNVSKISVGDLVNESPKIGVGDLVNESQKISVWFELAAH